MRVETKTHGRLARRLVPIALLYALSGAAWAQTQPEGQEGASGIPREITARDTVFDDALPRAERGLIVTVEDNVRMGGAGSAVNEVLVTQHHNVPVLNLGLPDEFVEHGGRDELLSRCGLDGPGILRAIQRRLRSKDLDRSESGPQRQAN